MFSFPVLVWFTGAATLGGTVTPTAIRADTITVTDTLPSLLTEDKVERLKVFWESFLKESKDVKIGEGRILLEVVPVSLPIEGEQVHFRKLFVNMAALAKKYPTVAEDFQRANLTPQQWDEYRLALWYANMTDNCVLGRRVVVSDTSSVIGKNITFMRAHEDMYKYFIHVYGDFGAQVCYVKGIEKGFASAW